MSAKSIALFEKSDANLSGLEFSSQMNKQDAVIDKCFLRGAPKERLDFLFSKYRVIMTESLFYELLTTEAYDRARCFKRLPSIENPVVLVHNVGPILRWEVANQRPLSNIENVALDLRYQFNPGLSNESFELNSDQAHAREEWQIEMNRSAQSFADHSASLPIRFPHLRGYRPGANSREIDLLKQKVCSEPELIREIYSGRADEGWPARDCINEKWALYRWVQIRLFAELDYYRKYGEQTENSKNEKIEREYMDLEYCFVGCLAGGLATGDLGMAERFSALCPSGSLLTY